MIASVSDTLGIEHRTKGDSVIVNTTNSHGTSYVHNVIIGADRCNWPGPRFELGTFPTLAEHSNHLSYPDTTTERYTPLSFHKIFDLEDHGTGQIHHAWVI